MPNKRSARKTKSTRSVSGRRLRWVIVATAVLVIAVGLAVAQFVIPRSIPAVPAGYNYMAYVTEADYCGIDPDTSYACRDTYGFPLRSKDRLSAQTVFNVVILVGVPMLWLDWLLIRADKKAERKGSKK